MSLNIEESKKAVQLHSQTPLSNIFTVQRGKKSYIIGSHIETETVQENDHIPDPYKRSKATYVILPLTQGSSTPNHEEALVLEVKSHEKHTADIANVFHYIDAGTDITISKKGKNIYNTTTRDFREIKKLSDITTIIEEKKQEADKYKKSQKPIAKLKRGLLEFKNKSSEDKIDNILDASGKIICSPMIGLILSGVVIADGAEKAYDKVKNFIQKCNRHGYKTATQQTIQDVKKRLKHNEKKQPKEKKLSHRDALTILAIADSSQTAKHNSNTITIASQREIF